MINLDPHVICATKAFHFLRSVHLIYFLFSIMSEKAKQGTESLLLKPF